MVLHIRAGRAHLDFSIAVTGCLFFVPAASLLEELADGAP
jgi:hypothetical protein